MIRVTLLDAFLDQNDLLAADLTDEDRETLRHYVEHHSGGLIVAGCEHPNNPDLRVKLHDSWGDMEHVVVHTYHWDDPDVDQVLEFTSGHQAVERFLQIISGEDDLPEGYRWATEEEMDAADAIVVQRHVDSSGRLYKQGEADVAVPLTHGGGGAS